MNKLFVGNIPSEATADDVRNLFEPFGSIEDLFFALDRIKKRPRGFAFVTFAEEESARNALEKLDGADLLDRSIQVKVAWPKGEDPDRKEGPARGRGRSSDRDEGDRPQRRFRGNFDRGGSRFPRVERPDSDRGEIVRPRAPGFDRGGRGFRVGDRPRAPSRGSDDRGGRGDDRNRDDERGEKRFGRYESRFRGSGPRRDSGDVPDHFSTDDD